MKTSTFVLILIVGFGCRPSIIQPPETLAPPGLSGLVVVDAEIHALWHGQSQTVELGLPLTGGMLQLEGESRKLIGGRIVDDILVFSHLPAGTYRLKRLNSHGARVVRTLNPVDIGNRRVSVVTQRAMRLGNQSSYDLPRQIKSMRADTLINLSFTLHPGELKYIGKIWITDDLATDASSDFSRQNYFDISNEIYDEIAIWESFLYYLQPDTGWAGRVMSRLRELKGGLDRP